VLIYGAISNAGARIFRCWSRPADWKNRAPRPNPDALFFMIFFNPKNAGPIVIDVAPAEGDPFAANIDTVWQMLLRMARARTDSRPVNNGVGGFGLICLLQRLRQVAVMVDRCSRVLVCLPFFEYADDLRLLERRVGLVEYK
jgi:hypothetical protein